MHTENAKLIMNNNHLQQQILNKRMYSINNIYIAGAWLVQIKNAGHAVMDQYPEEIYKIINTFLSTTAQSN
jgi:hypothetical protein